MEPTQDSKVVVVIVSDPSPEAWWRLSFLKRSDLVVHPAKDYATALDILAKVPCSLLIVEERPGGGMTAFLNSLRKAFVAPSFKVVLLCDRLPPSPPAPPVVRTLPRPCAIATFDMCLAEILGLPQRRSRRLLARIQLTPNATGDSLVGPAATLDLSVEGMRIETADSLALGQQYVWTFSGSSELAGMRVQGTVLREDTPSPKDSLHHYAIRFDHMSSHDRQTMGSYLNKEF